MSMSLRAQYESQGFAFPLHAMSGECALSLRARLEAVESNYGDIYPIKNILKNHPYTVFPFVDEIVRSPSILDAVSTLLGPNLLVWGCTFFIKEPQTENFVSWHQDLTYWGLESTEEVTAWLALSPATVESGCMRFVPGSHRRAVSHRDTGVAENLLSRAQEILVAVDEREAVNVVLEPGQFSLHHGLMFHASHPNRSTHRRIGVAIRYIRPTNQQVVGSRDFAMLVKGEDPFQHFEPLPPAPKSHEFHVAVLPRLEEIAKARSEFYFNDGDALWQREAG